MTVIHCSSIALYPEKCSEALSNMDYLWRSQKENYPLGYRVRAIVSGGRRKPVRPMMASPNATAKCIHVGHGGKLPDFRDHCLESTKVWLQFLLLFPMQVKDLLGKLIM